MAGIGIQSTTPKGPASPDQIHLEDLLGLEITVAGPRGFTIGSGATLLQVSGQDLTYDADGQLDGGVITSLQFTDRGLYFSVSGVSVPAQLAYQWVVTGANQAALDYILAGNDTVFGSSGANVLRGGPGDDQLEGKGGMDRLEGGPGNDYLTNQRTPNFWTTGSSTFVGGAGDDRIVGDVGAWNTALFSGQASDYELRFEAGTLFVTDRRPGSPDGTDRLEAITHLQFASGAPQFVGIQSGGQAAALAASEVLRDPDRSLNATAQWIFNLPSGATPQEVMSLAADKAAATSTVAVLSYQFFTGHAPTAAGMDYLVSPTGPNPNNLNSVYYQSFNLENRYINFAVNLGKFGEGKAGFASEYGSLNLFEATKLAYAEIFGAAPTDAKVHALLDPTFSIGGKTMSRAEYFAFYGGDGPDGQGTKAAMVGWLTAEAVKAEVGTYARSAEAFFADVVLQEADYGVDVIGQYGKAEYVYQGG